MKYLSKQTTTWATEKVSTNLELLKVDYSRITQEISEKNNQKEKRRRKSHMEERAVVSRNLCLSLASWNYEHQKAGY